MAAWSPQSQRRGGEEGEEAGFGAVHSMRPGRRFGLVNSDLGIEKRGGGRGGEQCGLWRRSDGGKRIWNRKKAGLFYIWTSFFFIFPSLFCVLMSFLYTFSLSLFREDLFYPDNSHFAFAFLQKMGYVYANMVFTFSLRAGREPGQKRTSAGFSLDVFTLHRILHYLAAVMTSEMVTHQPIMLIALC